MSAQPCEGEATPADSQPAPERRPRLARKRVTVREDGRYVVYYEFEDAPSRAEERQ